MKPEKILYYLVYSVFIILLTYHFCLFFSLFFPGSSINFASPVSIFGQLSSVRKIIYSVLALLSLVTAIIIAYQSNRLERILSLTYKNSIIRFIIIDILLFSLFISPIFYSYDNSFLYSISENEKTRFFILFLCVLCLISYIFWYYTSLHIKRKTAEHKELCKRISEENEILKQQIKEDNLLLEKWQKDIENYSERLNKIEGVSQETTEYYNSIRNSFRTLNSEKE